MSKEQRDIIIIGAGPAGSAAARAAALAGLRPLLIEKDETPGATRACGGFAAYAFRRKLALPDDVVEREIRRVVLIIDGKPHVYAGKRPHYISFRRPQFDSFLAQRAVDAGAECLTSTRATILDPTSGFVGLKNLVTGAEKEVKGRIIIFADGPATMAAKAYGIGHRPGALTRKAIFYEIEGTYGDGETCELNLSTAHTKSYIWLFPKRECIWVGLGDDFRGGRPPLAERLDRFIEQNDILRGRSIRRKGSGLVPSNIANDLVGDGVMVVGDAAGLVNPITGGGIAFALASGKMAGLVAAEAIRINRTDRAILSHYPHRFRRSPYSFWLALMGLWRRQLDRKKPEDQPMAYIRRLRLYFALFGRLPVLV